MCDNFLLFTLFNDKGVKFMETYNSQNDTSDKLNKYIGSIIQRERKKKDLSIEELADCLDFAPGFLGLIERGQRGTSLQNLIKIAYFFKISLNELTGFDITKLKSNRGEIDNYNNLLSLIHELDSNEIGSAN